MKKGLKRLDKTRGFQPKKIYNYLLVLYEYSMFSPQGQINYFCFLCIRRFPKRFSQIFFSSQMCNFYADLILNLTTKIKGINICTRELKINRHF